MNKSPIPCGPYEARCASDRNPDYPLWYVRCSTGLNILEWILPSGILTDKGSATIIADNLNKNQHHYRESPL